jgi:uracil phosphoribosyltransferase
MAIWRNRLATDGAVMLVITPLPHRERTARTISCIRAICSTDGI